MHTTDSTTLTGSSALITEPSLFIICLMFALIISINATVLFQLSIHLPHSVYGRYSTERMSFCNIISVSVVCRIYYTATDVRHCIYLYLMNAFVNNMHCSIIMTLYIFTDGGNVKIVCQSNSLKWLERNSSYWSWNQLQTRNWNKPDFQNLALEIVTTNIKIHFQIQNVCMKFLEEYIHSKIKSWFQQQVGSGFQLPNANHTYTQEEVASCMYAALGWDDHSWCLQLSQSSLQLEDGDEINSKRVI